MSIKEWIKQSNWSRLLELRHFTLRNLMFYVAIIALFVTLFSLSGGWKAIGMNDFSFTWIAWTLFGIIVLILILLAVVAIKWLFSKRTDIKQINTDNDTKDEKVIAIANAITAFSNLFTTIIKKWQDKNK